MPRIGLVRWFRIGGVVAAALGLSAVMGTAADKEPVADMGIQSSFIVWQPHVPYEALVLTVATPDGEVLRSEFKHGEQVGFSLVDAKGNLLPDGAYIYELRVIPVIDKAVKQALAQARKNNNAEAVAKDVRRRGFVPSEPLTQSGGFTVAQGGIVLPGTEE